MTTVTIGKDRDGTYRIDIKGHAGRNIDGVDVVCAGVSTLAYTLLNTIADMDDFGKLNRFSVEEGDGFILIRVQPSKRYAFEFSCKFTVFRIGIEGLSKQYPDNVAIEDL